MPRQLHLRSHRPCFGSRRLADTVSASAPGCCAGDDTGVTGDTTGDVIGLPYLVSCCKTPVACGDFRQPAVHPPPLTDNRFLLIVSAPEHAPSIAGPGRPGPRGQARIFRNGPDRLARIILDGTSFTL